MAENLLAYALVGLPRAKEYLKRTQDTDDDERILQTINYVTGQAERYCNRPLLSRVWTDLPHDGDGTNELLAREYPVTALTGAKRFASDGIATVAMNITGARIRNERVLWLLNDSWDWGDGGALVSFTAGYVSPTHDSQIKALQGAALRWIQVAYQDWRDGYGRAAGITVGGEGVQVVEVDMPRDVKAALEPFRRFP